MTKLPMLKRPLAKPLLVALALAMVAPTLPLAAQSTGDPAAEARLRKLEAEMRAMQRVVVPGGDGKFFPPQVTATGAATTAGSPASTPVSSTPMSSTNGWNMPAELEPPPTHATTSSGNRPIVSRHCCRASRPITA